MLVYHRARAATLFRSNICDLHAVLPSMGWLVDLSAEGRNFYIQATITTF